jgi:hypothetical protein
VDDVSTTRRREHRQGDGSNPISADSTRFLSRRTPSGRGGTNSVSRQTTDASRDLDARRPLRPRRRLPDDRRRRLCAGQQVRQLLAAIRKPPRRTCWKPKSSQPAARSASSMPAPMPAGRTAFPEGAGRSVRAACCSRSQHGDELRRSRRLRSRLALNFIKSPSSTSTSDSSRFRTSGKAEDPRCIRQSGRSVVRSRCC